MAFLAFSQDFWLEIGNEKDCSHYPFSYLKCSFIGWLGFDKIGIRFNGSIPAI